MTEALEIEVWEDAAGARVRVSRITSYHGMEFCDWHDSMFLTMGFGVAGRETSYVRDARGNLADLVRGTSDGSATLPEGARNTGWRHDGRLLWLGADAAYLVRLGDPSDVERWPVAKRTLMCM